MKKELIVKYIVGEADQHDCTLVESWAAEHEDNRKMLEEMKVIWSVGGETEPAPEIDIDLAWSNFVRMRDQPVNDTTTYYPSRKVKKLNWVRIAASLLAFCLLGFWGLQSVLDVEKVLKADNQIQHDGLPDGSTVYLNTRSEMVYEKKWLGNDRKVKLLNGEVFFEIKSDREHPFVIESGKSKITVLGTSFHVGRDGMNTEVVVASGSVKVSRGGQEVVLKPNQKVVLSDTSSKDIQIDTIPDQLYRYYVHQEFIFENTPLQRVFEVLGKAYDKQFLIESAKTKALPYTATFEQQNLQEIIDVIRETFDLEISRKDSIYYIN